MTFSDRIMIGDRVITESSPTFIIAEAGVNHNGELETAKRLVDAACDAGVDAVKFQMFKTEDLILENIEKAPYQKRTTGKNSQYEMLKQLELEGTIFRQIQEYCLENNIIFLCTPFEKNSLEKLDSMDVPAYKISATDITNLCFLKQVAKKGKPMIVSAGMCYMEEVRLALETLQPINKDIILLHCTSNYPVKNEEVNLRVIDTFRQEFDILTGYSDHTAGIGAAPFAVVKGAKVIEKHLTLSREMTGPDHKASIEPSELKDLVNDIRRVEQYLGSGIKIPSLSECFTRKSLQKCLVAGTDIEQGDLFTEDNITAKRTGGKGIPALYYQHLIGRPAGRSYRQNDILMEQE